MTERPRELRQQPLDSAIAAPAEPRVAVSDLLDPAEDKDARLPAAEARLWVAGSGQALDQVARRGPRGLGRAPRPAAGRAGARATLTEPLLASANSTGALGTARG